MTKGGGGSGGQVPLSACVLPVPGFVVFGHIYNSPITSPLPFSLLLSQLPCTLVQGSDFRGFQNLGQGNLTITMPGTQSNRVRPRKAKGFPVQQLFILCKHKPTFHAMPILSTANHRLENSIMQNLRANFFLLNIPIYLSNDCVLRGNCTSIACSGILVELLTNLSRRIPMKSPSTPGWSRQSSPSPSLPPV